MKYLPILFLGIFFTLAFSWTGLVLSSHLQLGKLEPTTEMLVQNPDTGAMEPEEGGTLFPLQPVGSAQRGKDVYISEGCLYCHTQQVRRKGFGSDWERGWGDRQTVARDYIRQERVLLGTMRTGPDLMTVGARIPTTDWHYLHLYYPKATSEGSIMPPFPFLFELREIGAQGPSPDAISVPETLPGDNTIPDDYRVPEGYELVPTQRGKDLVAYLLSLRLDYELPEMKFSE